MRLLSIFFVTLFVTGCSLFKQPVPVVPKFPNATPELMKKCESLKQIEGDKVSIADMLKVVVNNYTLYYECSTKVDGWQDWYNEQKKIYETIKK